MKAASPNTGTGRRIFSNTKRSRYSAVERICRPGHCVLSRSFAFRPCLAPLNAGSFSGSIVEHENVQEHIDAGNRLHRIFGCRPGRGRTFGGGRAAICAAVRAGVKLYVPHSAVNAVLQQSLKIPVGCFQQLTMLTARPPRDVSLNCAFISRPVSAMAAMTESSVTR